MRAVPLASRCVSSVSTPPAYPARMVVSVRLFAGLRERAGSERIEVELPAGATVADLLAAMELAPRSCVAAVNREYAGPDTPIGAGDEGALVPPVSGGAPGAGGGGGGRAGAGGGAAVAVAGRAARGRRAGRRGARPPGRRGRALRRRHAGGRGARLRGLRRDGRAAAGRHRGGGGGAPRTLRGRGRAPHRDRAAERAERARRGQRAAPRGGVRGRPRGHRPGEGGGPDLEGGDHGRRPAPRRGHVAARLTPVRDSRRWKRVRAGGRRSWEPRSPCSSQAAPTRVPWRRTARRGRRSPSRPRPRCATR